MCSFKVGQHVVCIHDGPWVSCYHGNIFNGPKKNAILKITDMEPSPLMMNGVYLIGLAFREFPHACFVHRLFRPLQEKPKKTSIEIFKKLQTPNKIKELT